MRSSALHPWTQDPDEAARLQESLRSKVVLSWDGRFVNTIGGVDLHFTSSSVRAGIAVFSYPGLARLSTAIGELPLEFPYIPGLLAFRVGPAILSAWERLPSKPDVVLVHGHGIAHPRGIGLASHLGLWFDLPTIGVAKSPLYGHTAAPGPQVGEWSEVTDEANPSHIIGAALRTRLKARPIYISPGHLIDLQHAFDIVIACCRGDRLPKPVCAAHQVATGVRYI